MAQGHHQQSLVLAGEAHFHGGGVGNQSAGLVAAQCTFGFARGARGVHQCADVLGADRGPFWADQGCIHHLFISQPA